MKKPRHCCCTVVLIVCLAASGTFINATSAMETTQPNPIHDLIEHGKQLEREGRWGEALSHYQHALKNDPENRQIKTRRSIARIHFDLDRRYSDVSYIKSINKLDTNKALALYSEVLLKIQSYYVDQPDWENIVRHGLASMEIALSDPEFVKANLPGVSRQRIQKAVDDMNSILPNLKVTSRQDTYNIANTVCRNLQRDTGLSIQSSSHEFICGAVIALDVYSAYMTGNQYGETMSQIEGNFVGLGVELKTHPDHLEIVHVISAGPAGRANMEKGDHIIAVNGKSVSELGGERAADELRGIEGSNVIVSVRKKSGLTNQLNLIRRRVDIPSVEDASIVDKQSGIGYLRLTNFQKTTAREFDEALWKLHKLGMRCLIVDVRGNPGGLLNSSVQIADRFLSSGVIVSTRGRNPMEDYTHYAHASGTWRVPLVVLVDENSASASEIFAAAIQDHGRGRIVGSRSYGKGSVQGIFPLNLGIGGVRLTTAKFFSPRGIGISDRGVTPEVTVQVAAKPDTADSIASDSDPIFNSGVTAAKNMLSSTPSRN